MKYRNTFFYTIFLVTGISQASEEYLYPVDTIEHEGQQKLCVLHQKGSRLELWFWSPETKEATKGLLSYFTPAGVTVLPNKKGFSFIDHDRVRVKSVNKRSPKSIDFYGPYDLTRIHWIDEKTFYFGAKERQHSNLFHATIDGDLYRLTVSNTNDYIYPQKVGEKLFFIERNAQLEYSILQAPYPSKKLAQLIEHDLYSADFQITTKPALGEEESPYQALIDFDAAERIVNMGTKTIAFLKMQTAKRGFFVEHPEIAERTQKSLPFSYHLLYKETEGWKTKKLFEFELPLHLLVVKKGRTRLYESILPLLPYYDNSTIYYVTLCPKTDSLDVFAYHLNSGAIEQKTFSERFEQNYFTPRIAGNSLFCGGSVCYDIRNVLAPSLDVDESGTEFFTFLGLAREVDNS